MTARQAPAGTGRVVLPTAIGEQAARTPDATALVDGEETLSYAELDARSGRLARLVADRGGAPGVVVAVVLNRSADLVVTLLAVLKTGAAYVPVDPADPPERIRHVIADSAASLVLASATAAGPPLSDRNVLHVDAPGTAAALVPGGAEPLPAATPSPDAAAYAIYTSGSTGLPKGVLVEHRALSAYLTYACDAYRSAAGRSLLHSSASFDMAVSTLYVPLVLGGTIHITDLRDGAPPDRAPDFLKATPSHLGLLRNLPPGYSPTGQLVVGGEALAATALDAWRQSHPGTEVVNEYGPTEAAVGCCVRAVAPGEAVDPGPVPIGRPIPGVRLHLLGPDLRPVAPGETGEVFIAGEQLARGYLNQPGTTATRFVADPYGPPGSRMYRTGDLARQREDGDLEYLGRVDDQVKIRGYRVEPGEVEAVLLRHPGVSQAAVVARDDGGSGRRLVAYAVPGTGAGLDPDDLLKHLAEQLPEYLVPSAAVLMSALPLNGNGKLDTRALPAPERGGRAVHVPARDDRERTLCRIVEELTGVLRVGIDDDFFALGGDSIMAARLATLARREGVELSLRDVLNGRTVRRLAHPGETAGDAP